MSGFLLLIWLELPGVVEPVRFDTAEDCKAAAQVVAPWLPGAFAVSCFDLVRQETISVVSRGPAK